MTSEFDDSSGEQHHSSNSSASVPLEDNARVAVIGGGPAGSFFAYFLLHLAERLDTDLSVDIFEPRDFSMKGPKGCNMCGGIISESLVQALAAEGINLPPTVVRRGIDSYVLHMDVGDVKIATPEHEKRIAAVYRGSGPRALQSTQWQSFDGYLLSLAVARGARLMPQAVERLDRRDGRPAIAVRGAQPAAYDLVAICTGVNSPSLKRLAASQPGFRQPGTTKTYIREFDLGPVRINEVLGTSMHVFLLPIPRLEFAAIIPKGACASICLLGDDIDKDLLQTFLSSPEVVRCMPAGWDGELEACQCAPRMNIRGAARPYGDRLVFVGDAAVTRLYKDGIGAAYRTAKAAATAALLHGVSARDFKRHFWPILRKIERDNHYGRVVFGVTEQIKRRRFARRAILGLVRREQALESRAKPMSTVLWDMFTGSASYREVFRRTLGPLFLLRLALSLATSLAGFRTPSPAPAGRADSELAET